MVNKSRKVTLDKRGIKEALAFDTTEFDEQYQVLMKICDNLSNIDKANVQSLKNYVAIRMVSIFESELKMMISDLVDSYNVSAKQALQEENVTINLDDMDYVKNDEFTTGKFVTSNLGYMTNTTTLSTILSNITNLKFFEWISKLLGIKFDIQKQLKSLFDERNDIIHQLKDIDDSPDSLKEKVRMLQGFCHATHILSSLHLDSEKIHLDEKLVTFDITKEKFEKTTKDCLLQLLCGDCQIIVEHPKFIPRDGQAYYCDNCHPKHRRKPF